MNSINEQLWEKIVKGVEKIQEAFPDGAAFIGDVAVYYHCLEDEKASLFYALSFDADFVISSADFSLLKDVEAVAHNPRLGKHSFVRNDVEYDVYVEYSSDLNVPVTDILCHSIVLEDGLRLCCLEHLLKLKLAAWEDRKNSSKGQKDADDLCRILYLLGKKDLNTDAAIYIDDEDVKSLREIVRGQAPLRLAENNFQIAKQIRVRCQSAVDDLNDFLTDQMGGGGYAPPGRDRP